MSNELLTRAWQCEGLSMTERIVLVALADRANGDAHAENKTEQREQLPT